MDRLFPNDWRTISHVIDLYPLVVVFVSQNSCNGFTAKRIFFREDRRLTHTLECLSHRLTTETHYHPILFATIPHN